MKFDAISQEILSYFKIVDLKLDDRDDRFVDFMLYMC